MNLRRGFRQIANLFRGLRYCGQLIDQDPIEFLDALYLVDLSVKVDDNPNISVLTLGSVLMISTVSGENDPV